MQDYLKLKSGGLVCCARPFKRDKMPWQSPRCGFIWTSSTSHFPSRCVFALQKRLLYVTGLLCLIMTSQASLKGPGALPKCPFQVLPWQSSHELSASTILKTLCPQFSQYLHENASYVRPLEEGMLHLFESITEDTVTVLVRFPPFRFQKDFYRAQTLTCCFFLSGNNCEIEGLLRTFGFLLRLFKKDSSLSVKKVPFISQIKFKGTVSGMQHCQHLQLKY